ncbi:Methylcobalamin:coenzyme M methyltransferase MtbA [Methanonatronarchaeum thermophilum]|uniref:Methylcobalamin:coenzyme M methyltransferase MtbA n=1 Tax=Methanonatronarchaeum thermophilum TaxID=1927129 RepID=A0A1Y3G9C2_9EURY|nr:MtaA/CmuA family methyltransferase [Methanonatronarchaeum thermophilum]OUJ18051.1 Methylcobalamin:coenzyme M methyltransferase MtbA [Methanonatronarchaeum thermophilum]
MYGCRERFFRALDLVGVDRVPCVMPLQTGTVDLMRLCGCFWPGALREGWSMSVLGMAGFRFGGVESVRFPFDMNVVCEFLGCRLRYPCGFGQPVIVENAISGLEGVGGLEVGVGGRMSVVGEAVGFAKDIVGGRVPVLAALSGPFYVAGQVRGMEEFLLEVYKGCDGVFELLDVCLDVCQRYASYLVECGADCVVVLGVSTDLISPTMYREYALPYQKELVSGLDRSILHICGDTTPIFSDMVEVGADGVSVDSVVSLRGLKDVVGDECAVLGNVPPVDALLFGDQKKVVRESRRSINEGCDILCSGCGLPPETPIENLIAMTETAKTYKKQKN